MDLMTTDILGELIQETGKDLISIYMPTHTYGREQQQDPIRLKNLLTQAKDRLHEHGMRTPDIEERLNLAENLLRDESFWQHQSHGLALFISPDLTQTFRLPIDFEEMLIITERFHIKPLLKNLSRGQHFYILAVSQNDIRLLQGDQYQCAEVELENVPKSLDEALWDDDPERQLQYHSSTNTPGRGIRPSIYHGHGVTDDSDKTNLLRYFQIVDKGIVESVGNEQAPMVLAGVDYLLPIYKDASDYPMIVEQIIAGNPDTLSVETLHQAAWKIVEPIFQIERDEALKQFEMLKNSGNPLASDQLKEVLAAAHYGRVDILFAALGIQAWGTFDPHKNKIHLHPEFESGDQDLLDLAVVQTLSNGGTVYGLEPESMPGQAELAAIFRYAYED